MKNENSSPETVPASIETIIEDFQNHASFEIEVSGNGKNLLNRMIAGKTPKVFEELSERDQSKWNGIQKVHATWIAGKPVQEPEPDQEESAPVLEYTVFGRLNDGKVQGVTEEFAIENIGSKYTSKTFLRMLDKGKVVQGNEGWFFCRSESFETADPKETVQEPEETVQDAPESPEPLHPDEFGGEDYPSEVSEPEIEYDLSQVSEITGSAQIGNILFTGSNANLAAQLFGLKVEPSEDEDYVSISTVDLPKYLKIASDAGIKLLVKEDEEITAEHETEDSEDMVDISAPEVIEETSTALVIQEPKGDLLDVITTEENFDEFGELSDEDKADLERIEAEIIEELPNWEKSNDFLGARFAEINKRKLYRKTHRSFPKYILEKFNVTRAKAYQLIISSEVRAAIADGGNEVKILPSQRASQTLNQITNSVMEALKENHSALELENYDKQLHRAIWEITIQSAPKDGNGEPIISPAHLESVKTTIGRIIETKTINVDGSDVPVNLLNTFVDSSITEETSERTARQKSKIVDEIKKSNDRKSAPQERVSTGSKKTSGEFHIEAIICSCTPGEPREIVKMVFGGFKLDCGHAYVKEAGKAGLVFTDVIE